MAIILCGDIRSGDVVKFEGKLYRVYNAEHIKPGKGGAFNQVEMKDIMIGTKVNQRFRTEDKIEKAFIETLPLTFSYIDGSEYVFFKPDFDELRINMSQFEHFNYQFLTDNASVDAHMYEEQIIDISWPSKTEVVCTVVETDAYIKGQTAKASGKPAVLDNGFKLTIPAHLVTGAKILVDPARGEYVGVAHGSAANG